MKSWKTTLFGAIGAIGVFLTSQADPTLQVIGQVVSAIALFGIGMVAKDSNVTGGTKQQ